MPSVICFRDTAYRHDDYGSPDPTANAHWIWFGAAGDSVDIFAQRDTRSHESDAGQIHTNLGAEHTPRGADAAYFRRRLKQDGVVEVWVTLNDMIAGEILGDTAAYTLRFRRASPVQPTPLRATGQWATLTIATSHDTDQFSIVPVSIARSVRDLSKWTVFVRTYHVALVADSLYEICVLPCSVSDTVKLTPSARVTKKY